MVWRSKKNGVHKFPWTAWLVASSGNDALNVVASTRLTGRISLHVVQWEGGKLLLACSEQGVVQLATSPNAIEGLPQNVVGDLS